MAGAVCRAAKFEAKVNLKESCEQPAEGRTGEGMKARLEEVGMKRTKLAVAPIVLGFLLAAPAMAAEEHPGPTPQNMNLVDGQWTWASGSNGPSQAGTYGTEGLAAPGNVPGGRYDSVSWRDTSGNLWLFGGYGLSESGLGYLNDLWKWDGTNWTWVSGSDGLDQTGTYGTKGVTTTGNQPGAREGSVSWTDTTGHLWLFGGFKDMLRVSDDLNDLWKWDGASWTWVSGSSNANQAGIYGTKGIAAPANQPGARNNSVSWTATSGNLWLFGGSGYSASGQGRLNDLWKWFSPNAPLRFYTLPPCRVLDTRNAVGPLGGPALAADQTRTFKISESCGAPADAGAVSVNMTVAVPTSGGSLTVYPGTGPAPLTSALSFAAGKTRANNSIMGLIGGNPFGKGSPDHGYRALHSRRQRLLPLRSTDSGDLFHSFKGDGHEGPPLSATHPRPRGSCGRRTFLGTRRSAARPLPVRRGHALQTWT